MNSIFQRFQLPAILFVSILCLNPVFGQDAVLKEMYRVFNSTNKLSFKFRSFQRMDNGSRSTMKEKLMKVEMTQKPLLIDLELISPNEGMKVHYDENDKPAYAKVYINLGLGTLPKDFFIHGSTIMADTHHPVTSTGFKPIIDLVKGAERKARQEGRFNSVFIDGGKVTLDGRACRKIEIRDDRYSFVPYTAQKGESVLDIARKKDLAAYKIMNLNPDISKSYRSIEGQTIQIPTSYAKNTWLYIDESTKLPYMVEVHDEKGLFEKFYFMEVKM